MTLRKTDRRRPLNFIPPAPGSTPNYWCTWSCQGYCLQTPECTVADSMGDKGGEAITEGQRYVLNEDNIIGPRGWAQRFFPDCRGDLFLVSDTAGICRDMITGRISDRLNWMRTSFRPVLARPLNACVSSTTFAGMRAGAVQVCGFARRRRRYTSRRVRTARRNATTGAPACCGAATPVSGIGKLTGGARMFDLRWRQWLTELAREVAPDLVVEHSVMELETFTDFGANWRLPPDKLDECGDALGFSEVLRTYDVLSQHSVATTLARVAQLTAIGRQTGGNGTLNCEDEVYLGAALGYALGVMRYPLAPAFGTAAVDILIDDNVLYDTWTYRPGDTWCQAVIGKCSRQGAPARVARGLALPEVYGGGEERPFVVASRHCHLAAHLRRTRLDIGRGRCDRPSPRRHLARTTGTPGCGRHIRRLQEPDAGVCNLTARLHDLAAGSGWFAGSENRRQRHD